MDPLSFLLAWLGAQPILLVCLFVEGHAHWRQSHSLRFLPGTSLAHSMALITLAYYRALLPLLLLLLALGLMVLPTLPFSVGFLTLLSLPFLSWGPVLTLVLSLSRRLPAEDVEPALFESAMALRHHLLKTHQWDSALTLTLVPHPQGLPLYSLELTGPPPTHLPFLGQAFSTHLWKTLGPLSLSSPLTLPLPAASAHDRLSALSQSLLEKSHKTSFQAIPFL
jgi:hypothetical protein